MWYYVAFMKKNFNDETLILHELIKKLHILVVMGNPGLGLEKQIPGSGLGFQKIQNYMFFFSKNKLNS